ncbi:MAG: threonine-phosphate decarboxylase CobD [Pseudomonadota bacterium]|nr:threonine-phosphate decarboxylase CobD [Pseudomonadota bacterium]
MSRSLFPHGGDVRRLAARAGVSPGELLDFSANINPLGLPVGFRRLIRRRLNEILHYPEPWAAGVIAAVSRCYGIPPEEILIGNGSTEILYALPRALPRARAVIPVPSYADYATASAVAGMEVVKIALCEGRHFVPEMAALEERLRGDETVFIGQPNNPTGLSFPAEAIRDAARRHPKTVFVVDEAFADFVPAMDRLLVNRPPNVIVLCSLTKFYAIPGLRLGFAAGAAAVIEKLRRFIPPWTVNALAQAAGETFLDDDDYRRRTLNLVGKERRFLSECLRNRFGFHVYPGEANFLLARMNGRDMDVSQLEKKMLQRGIAIRRCDNFAGLDGRFFRVAVRKRSENEALLAALQEVWAAPPSPTR